MISVEASRILVEVAIIKNSKFRGSDTHFTRTKIRTGVS